MATAATARPLPALVLVVGWFPRDLVVISFFLGMCCTTALFLCSLVMPKIRHNFNKYNSISAPCEAECRWFLNPQKKKNAAGILVKLAIACLFGHTLLVVKSYKGFPYY